MSAGWVGGKKKARCPAGFFELLFCDLELIADGEGGHPSGVSDHIPAIEVFVPRLWCEVLALEEDVPIEKLDIAEICAI